MRGVGGRSQAVCLTLGVALGTLGSYEPDDCSCKGPIQKIGGANQPSAPAFACSAQILCVRRRRMARRWYVMETCREDVRREYVLQAGLQLSGMRGRYVQERVILPLQHGPESYQVTREHVSQLKQAPILDAHSPCVLWIHTPTQF